MIARVEIDGAVIASGVADVNLLRCPLSGGLTVLALETRIWTGADHLVRVVLANGKDFRRDYSGVRG